MQSVIAGCNNIDIFVGRMIVAHSNRHSYTHAEITIETLLRDSGQRQQHNCQKD